jgi:predicted phosphoadenosine phosphosulfate sulfurtransferase
VAIKRYKQVDVLAASKARIRHIFDNFERVYVSFSAGKDSTVLLHLAVAEAVRRKQKLGVLFVDLEGQYQLTIKHARACFEKYKDHIELYWVCLPLALRNATSNFQPRWTCWDPEAKDLWIRPLPEEAISDVSFFPFFQPGMEFEEFVALFGEWFSQGRTCASCVGIRTDESFNRFRALCSKTKERFQDLIYTTRITEAVYNAYPIYDWTVDDIWIFHYRNPSLPYNQIYDCMYRAGLKLSQMRICQPYGDDQRKGLWLFHILEPDTWGRVLARVTGANAGALYAKTARSKA